jgi:signal transduction histidine kinase
MAAILLIAFLLVGVLPAHFLVEAAFRTIGRPAALAAQIAVSAVGYFLFLGVSVAFLHLCHGGGNLRHRGDARKRRFNAFQDLMEALDKIAGGDFDVLLDAADGRNELAVRVNRMARQLSTMEHMRQDFVSNVSHEIQSPLTSIRGFAELLKKEELHPEERLRYAEVIEAESGRLSRLSDNLLRLSVLDADPDAFKPKAYRLDKQIERILLTLEPQWSLKCIELDVSLAQAFLLGDEDLLGQVWGNLLHNAIKFTPQDGKNGKIGVTLSVEGSEATCIVSDTGIGIPEESLLHVFERFYKADPARARAIGGSGLGLALAKKIVDIHGGTISVESELGAGSRFTVRLPGLVSGC